MNSFATDNLRLLLSMTVMALAAAVAMVALSVAPAGAASGGLTTTSGSEEETASQPAANSAKYERLWDGVRVQERRWARRTAECESGRDPDAIGGGGLYRGAFQFMRSTWKSSPKSPGGDPIAYPYRTQAVVAVMLKRRDGAHHWPVCG